jgi:NAD(P)-dependent dehydrogenase (short-subunit alcohol dehydrogenase family)
MATESKHILVTGGTGYIGSHTVVLLVEAGWHVTIIDNLANSNTGVLARLATITGKPEAVEFVECDLRDAAGLAAVFARHRFDSVIHFAGYKVGGCGGRRGEGGGRGGWLIAARIRLMASRRRWASHAPSRCCTTATTWRARWACWRPWRPRA